MRADAPVGVWLHSSSLQLAAPSTEAGPLYCIVSHGGLGDRFWRVVRGFSRQAAIDAGTDVRCSQSLDGDKQAAAIDRCAGDGAVVIASTLADSQAVRESLLAAKAGGSRIITFNSGDLNIVVELVRRGNDRFERDVQIAGVGPNGAVARQSLELRNRHLAFVTNHAGEAQAYLITAALKMIHEYPTPAKFILTPTILTATPFIYDSGAVRADPAEFAEAQRRLQARLALGDEYGSGE